MSDYAKASDLIARYGEDELVQLTDRDGSGGYDPATVGRALSDASALIDGYVAARYTLPLAETPALLIGLCCDLARHALHADAAPEVVTDRRDQALARLRDISAGRLRLDATVPAAAPSGTVQMTSSERLFSRAAR